MWRDEYADSPTLVSQVGKTQLGYQLRCIDDLHAMPKEADDWVPLVATNEQKPAAERTVEARGRWSTTRWAAGTAPRRDCAGGSACTRRG
jgi:hypothetical protein